MDGRSEVRDNIVQHLDVSYVGASQTTTNLLSMHRFYPYLMTLLFERCNHRPVIVELHAHTIFLEFYMNLGYIRMMFLSDIPVTNYYDII